ncbi:hypothetical protein GUJ93_ZPchr0008g12799 [Zizania palustris]|uniref:Uncharacterized protein n=1 Tax=Zizania palustris TaxID=103762 RepID=A0A8J5RI21_ZIZPA|nr:hypothetical protein GUJ93_ZPchr0008g12799 [Zizania palustris]
MMPRGTVEACSVQTAQLRIGSMHALDHHFPHPQLHLPARQPLPSWRSPHHRDAEEAKASGGGSNGAAYSSSWPPPPSSRLMGNVDCEGCGAGVDL